MSYDPYKHVWLNPNIEYLFNAEIIEYDMRDAGFSIIKQFKLLPDSEIRHLESLAKGDERHRAIGILQRDDKAFAKVFNNKFGEMRSLFIGVNNITDDDIISVKKDAIFTIGERKRRHFGQIEFVPKNYYTSYIRFTDNQNIELYYNSEGIDVKGIGDIGVNKHRLYMMEFLRKIIGYIESDSQYTKRYLRSFIKDYKMGLLDEEYYLEFNNMSREKDPMFNYMNLIVPIVQIVLKVVP